MASKYLLYSGVFLIVIFGGYYFFKPEPKDRKDDEYSKILIQRLDSIKNVTDSLLRVLDEIKAESTTFNQSKIFDLLQKVDFSFDHSKYNYGLDIAHFQGGFIEWQKLKKFGLDFVFIKISDPVWKSKSAETQARNFDRSQKQANEAKSVGFKIGYYHYARPKNIPNVYVHSKMQAFEFIKTVSKYPKSDFPLVIDFESEDNININPNNKDWLLEWLNGFIHVIDSMGYKYMIYSNRNTINSSLPIDHGLSNMPIWVSGFPCPPVKEYPQRYQLNGWVNNWDIWQISDVFLMDGIYNNDYLNKHGNISELADKYLKSCIQCKCKSGDWKDCLVKAGIDQSYLPFVDLNIMKREFYSKY